MKFKIKRNLFLKHINRANKGIAVKTPQDVLRGLYLEVFDDRIQLTGSNQSLRIETEIPAGDDLEIVTTGAVVVNAKLVTDIIRRMANETINIELVNQKMLRIFDDDTEFKVQIAEKNDYPQVQEGNFENEYTMATEVFSEVLRNVLFAVSKLEIQMVMTGVNLRFEKGKIYFVATDSHRLSQRIIDAPEVNSSFSVIIPGSNLNVLLGLLEEEKEVKMAVNDELVLRSEEHTSELQSLV